MLFTTLNDGRTINLVHIYLIERVGNKVVYKTAKGSLDDIEEVFDTVEEAQTRYSELEELILD